MPTGRLDPVHPERPAREPPGSARRPHRDDVPGGTARGSRRAARVRRSTRPASRSTGRRDVDRSRGHDRSACEHGRRGDPARPPRPAVDEAGVGLDQGGAGVEPGAGVLGGGDAADRDEGEVVADAPCAAAAAPPASARPAARRRGRRRRSASTSRPGVRRPSRQIVVLVAMMPVEAESQGQVGHGQHVVVGEVGGDLDQQRHAPAGTSSATRRTASSSGPSRSTAWRLRRPGRVGRADVDDQVVGVRREQAGATCVVVGQHGGLVVLGHDLGLADVDAEDDVAVDGDAPLGGAAGRRPTSAPSLLKPIRLTIARSAGSRNSRGCGLPGCGSPVTVPTSTCPKPSAARASMPTAFLSKPAARPERGREGQPHRA